MYRVLLTLFLAFNITFTSYAQETDTLQTVASEYPYIFPLMGRKAHNKGYKLPLPHGIMINTLFNKQGIVLSDFQMDFTKIGGTPDFDRLQELSDLVVFGPSDGTIRTFNVRFDTWILPFLSIGGYYGQVKGSQTITLTAPITLSSETDINGEYYGLNLLVALPLGPLNLAMDYSASWTTNDRLDEPVRVDVSGIRLIKRFVNKRRSEKNFAVWGGVQFQNLADETRGKIDLAEALGIDENVGEELDAKWNTYKTTPEWDELSGPEKIAAEAKYQTVKGIVEQVGETTVHYRFKKKLEYDWNMLLGAQYQFNETWQLRTEYGFLKSKQQIMLSLNYRFGL